MGKRPLPFGVLRESPEAIGVEAYVASVVLDDPLQIGNPLREFCRLWADRGRRCTAGRSVLVSKSGIICHTWVCSRQPAPGLARLWRSSRKHRREERQGRHRHPWSPGRCTRICAPVGNTDGRAHRRRTFPFADDIHRTCIFVRRCPREGLPRQDTGENIRLGRSLALPVGAAHGPLLMEAGVSLHGRLAAFHGSYRFWLSLCGFRRCQSVD